MHTLRSKVRLDTTNMYQMIIANSAERSWLNTDIDWKNLVILLSLWGPKQGCTCCFSYQTSDRYIRY